MVWKICLGKQKCGIEYRKTVLIHKNKLRLALQQGQLCHCLYDVQLTSNASLKDGHVRFYFFDSKDNQEPPSVKTGPVLN